MQDILYISLVLFQRAIYWQSYFSMKKTTTMTKDTKFNSNAYKDNRSCHGYCWLLHWC